MVGVFRRSLSFPNKINPNRPTKPTLSHHVRSISLPCRSHPLISQLKDEINELKSWESKSSTTSPGTNHRTSNWLCDGLSRLKTVHDSLDDLLQLPQTQESLRRFPDFVEKVLDDFLRFVDVYGNFQTSVLSFKEAQLAAQFAIRRRDESKLGPYFKSLKKIAKEMNKLVSTVRCIEKSVSSVVREGDYDELAEVIKNVHEVTIMVSIALFNGISSSTSSRKSLSWAGLKMSKKTKRDKVDEGIQEFKQVGIETLWPNLNKKGDEEVRMVLKRMQELEGCIGCIDTGSDKIFRSLINTRVSLLNVLTF